MINELKIDKTLTKCGIWTDQHFGKKGNSATHNEDCLNFIQFFMDKCKEEGVDHIVFMGDWFDNRHAINTSTLNYSYKALEMLSTMNIPIFMIVGNHDLFLRHQRTIHSMVYFSEVDHIHMIDKPTLVKFKNVETLFLPFLFEHEYTELFKDINAAEIIFGHLEFKGFVVTGDSKTLDHGPDHTVFKSPKRIFTGHFHKRQIKDNIVYIGNPFPFDYSDANDTKRGMATYEYSNDELKFIDWAEAPTYIKCKLSELMKNHKKLLRPLASVRCLDDVNINIDESKDLKELYFKKYNLREFFIEEQIDDITLDEDEISLEGMEQESTEHIIKELLKKVNSDSLSNDKLVAIYEKL